MIQRLPRVAPALLCALALPAFAQSFPSQPVKLVVPYTPGGPVDIVARTLQQPLAEALKQPIVIDNRTGAGGNIGSDLVAKSAPDGHSLLVNTATMLITQALGQKLPFDPINDFRPVVKIAQVPALLVVTPNLEAKSVAELIALAKAKPGALNFGTPGAGGSLHMATELFASLAGIKLTHVPFRGGAESTPRLIAGDLQLMFDPVATSLPLAKSGRLRALAVSSKERSPLAPDIPTIAESGLPGYDFAVWYGLFAPAKTPQAVVDRIASETLRALARPDIRDGLVAKGMTVIAHGPDAFAADYANEYKVWSDLIKRAGLKIE